MQIKQAKRRKKKGRILFAGPSGSGKTWAALVTAKILAGPDGKVGVIDTENGSAEMFAGEWSADLGEPIEFDVIELAPPFTPERYIEACKKLADEGYSAIVVDSTTHEWDGPGGCLEIHGDESARTKNSYTAWEKVTPRHKNFLDRVVVRSPVHVIGTARAKTEYAMTKDDNGKVKIERLGTGPIQRTQFEFEWDVQCDVSLDHSIFVTKSRVRPVDGKVYKMDIRSFAESVKAYLEGGAELEPEPAKAMPDRNDLVELASLGDKDAIRARSMELFSKAPIELDYSQYQQLRSEFES